MAHLPRHADMGLDLGRHSWGRQSGCRRCRWRVVLPPASRYMTRGIVKSADHSYREEPTHAAPMDVTTAAVHRATGTSLGSICLGAGIVATVRVVGRTAAEGKRVTSPRSNILPAPLSFLSYLTPAFAIIAGVLDQLNGYALVYVGITGEAFWPSARRAVGLAKGRKGAKLLDCQSTPLGLARRC